MGIHLFGDTGETGEHVGLYRCARRRRHSALSTTLAVAVLSSSLLLATGCSAPASPVASDSPSPSPSASLIPPPGVTDDATPAPDGPTEPAPLPTETAELGDTVSFDTGIGVEITSVTAMTVDAKTPGEVSGPAVTVTVTAINDATEAQSLESAVVTLTTDDGQLGIGTTAGSPAPFTGAVEPGETATGTYVFMLDPAEDRSVSVSVNYAAGEPVAVFTGKVS